MAILRRIEKAMMRAMCGVKIIQKRRSQELMSLLGLKDTLDIIYVYIFCFSIKLCGIFTLYTL